MRLKKGFADFVCACKVIGMYEYIFLLEERKQSKSIRNVQCPKQNMANHLNHL